MGKTSPPPGFDPRTVQPVASRYTDWATRLTIKYIIGFIVYYFRNVVFEISKNRELKIKNK
jgi:sugar phosphate permease